MMIRCLQEMERAEENHGFHLLHGTCRMWESSFLMSSISQGGLLIFFSHEDFISLSFPCVVCHCQVQGHISCPKLLMEIWVILQNGV
jgi:hypothetical protein